MSEPQSPQDKEVKEILDSWHIEPDIFDRARPEIEIIRSHHYSGLERHAETLRRFIIATAGDVKIILAAFALRLAELRKSINTTTALETLEVYAPLANRLGMGKLKTEFETLVFPIAYPNEYKKTKQLVNSRLKEAEKNLEHIYRALRKYLAKENIPIIKSDSRLKNVYSLYKKLCRPEIDMDIGKIHDLLALRLVTDSTENCYRIMGLIHSKWKPVPRKIKDYIANPKPNGYQSLHTTVYTGSGATVEIQIRTEKMHEEAEYGVTSHVAYDESGKPHSGGKWSRQLSWVKELVDLAKKTRDTGEFAEAVKLDYFKNRIFVFTPKGDVIELPEGATPIDFAYAVHSAIGDHAHGAIINGKYRSLNTPLHGREVVQIETKPSAHPSPKWLEHAITLAARKKIRSSLKR